MRTTLFRVASAAALATLTLTSVTATAAAQSGARDLMFAIDTTGSMAPYIEQTKIAVDDLATDLASESAGTRVGLVEYRDAGDPFQARTVTDLTTNLPTFRGGLDGLGVDGGGDWPESVYSGIALSLCQAWNSSSVKAIIAVGDAPAKDPEPVTDLTADRIIALANGTATDNPYCAPAAVAAAAVSPMATGNRVPIFVVSADGELTAQFARIAEETGGATVPVEDIEDIAEAIKDTVDVIDEGDGGLFGSLEGSLENLFGSAGN
ncbi:VWA domain-containing protein [Dietzia massiliensis]|uniref:VWA domain-containing protein n=1 Tax=Dietzia massiliensis TaxID=2697499 RepID=UPI001BCEC3C1|nr:vWA domain-containing protein [Dietzia massiliensis]MBS7546956.1 VWA domain-containing protein [Dietzia massiliensis]